MRILLIGSGGREHALAWKIAASPKCDKLYCAPGNGGISEIAETVRIAADDIGALLKFAQGKGIDLTVVGPEAPLEAGIVDLFQKNRLRIFGPTKELARIESSKVYAKELMKRFSVPTAGFEVFTDAGEAIKYIESHETPLVVKADGLCAGKGVVVAKTVLEAKLAVQHMMVDRIFKAAGDRVIVEECLEGEEASIIVVSDGKTAVPLASSQDHKRVYNNDKGPNTGGMGAYSPAPVVTNEIFKGVIDNVIKPVIDGLAREDKNYVGALYAGIMITKNGPKVLEFNARFGDPETQAILPRMKGDFVELLDRAVDGTLEGFKLDWDPRPCVSVALVSGGYPGEFVKGMEIRGLENTRSMKDVIVFHAGTSCGRRAQDPRGMCITNGGRVLNVTAMGSNIRSAIDRCYEAIDKIHFDKMHYRKDIGYRALKSEADVRDIGI